MIETDINNPFPILHILTIIFVLSKILGYIDWSWFLVLLPTIIEYIIQYVKLALVISILKKKSSWTKTQ